MGSTQNGSKTNSGDGHLQGIEFRGRYDFDEHWSAHGMFSWTDGQLESFPTAAPVLKEEVFTCLNPIQGSLGVRWQIEDGAFWIMPSVLVVDAQDRRDTQRISAGGTPGYTIWSLNAGFSSTRPGVARRRRDKFPYGQLLGCPFSSTRRCCVPGGRTRRVLRNSMIASRSAAGSA